MKVSHIYKSRGEKQHLTRHIISIVKHHKHSKCVLIKKPIFQRRRENMIRMLKYFEEWHESEIFLLCCYIIVYQIQKLMYEIVYVLPIIMIDVGIYKQLRCAKSNNENIVDFRLRVHK